ncbi:MAG: nucleotidyltransferase family protein [Gammaproteobacteria bacterium]|nr:nucleotidyltransferase family protein [Gammaproteobacteria bacterium]MCP5426100.1 nucleotidyltransferase family protein [Gammaproteobacteria bacterium]
MKQGILLAAGFSRRFGCNKLLQPLADGRPMALAAACHLRDAVSQVLAVINDESSELMPLFRDSGIAVTVCPNAQDGMGASLAWAVRASPQAQAWIIALADMPYVPPDLINQVAQTVRLPWDIAAPFNGDRRGHPVGFGSAYYASLSKLKGDRGANSVIQAHANHIHKLACNDNGIFIDIDTPESLQNFARKGRKD